MFAVADLADNACDDIRTFSQCWQVDSVVVQYLHARAVPFADVSAVSVNKTELALCRGDVAEHLPHCGVFGYRAYFEVEVCGL